MADIEEGTRDREEVPVAGKPRTFRYLNTYGKAALVREMRKGAKAALLESLTMAGLEPADKAQALADFDQDPPGNWVDYVRTHEGTLAALRLSLEMTYPKEGEQIMRDCDLGEGDTFSLMLKVCGLKVVDEPAVGGATSHGTDPNAAYGNPAGENESDPPEPLTYSTTQETAAATATN